MAIPPAGAVASGGYHEACLVGHFRLSLGPPISHSSLGTYYDHLNDHPFTQSDTVKHTGHKGYLFFLRRGLEYISAYTMLLAALVFPVKELVGLYMLV